MQEQVDISETKQIIKDIFCDLAKEYTRTITITVKYQDKKIPPKDYIDKIFEMMDSKEKDIYFGHLINKNIVHYNIENNLALFFVHESKVEDATSLLKSLSEQYIVQLKKEINKNKNIPGNFIKGKLFDIRLLRFDIRSSKRSMLSPTNSIRVEFKFPFIGEEKTKTVLGHFGEILDIDFSKGYVMVATYKSLNDTLSKAENEFYNDNPALHNKVLKMEKKIKEGLIKGKKNPLNPFISLSNDIPLKFRILNKKISNNKKKRYYEIMNSVLQGKKNEETIEQNKAPTVETAPKEAPKQMSEEKRNNFMFKDGKNNPFNILNTGLTEEEKEVILNMKFKSKKCVVEHCNQQKPKGFMYGVCEDCNNRLLDPAIAKIKKQFFSDLSKKQFITKIIENPHN
jgi:hypothetical protein